MEHTHIKTITAIMLLALLGTLGLALVRDEPEIGTAVPSVIPPEPVTVNGKTISFPYTDDTTDEDLLIYSSQQNYSGIGKVTMYVAVVNNSSTTQNTNFRALATDPRVDLLEVYELDIDVPHSSFHNVYGEKTIGCPTGWVSTVNEVGDSVWACGEVVEYCNAISGRNCVQNEGLLRQEERITKSNEWRDLTLRQPDTRPRQKSLPAGFTERSAFDTSIPQEMTKYFKIVLDIPDEWKVRGEVSFEAVGDSAYGQVR